MLPRPSPKTLRRVQRGLPLLVAAGLLALATTWRPAIAPISPPDRSAFPIADVERGTVLAKLGDCAVCHTAQGGTPLAGGRALATPFGTLYSNNITPDPAMGIGRWSLAAFTRAMQIAGGNRDRRT